MLATLEQDLRSGLADLERKARRRSCPELTGPDRARPTIEAIGRAAISFCSNDYLGLAGHPALAAAAAAAAKASGFGASASRLVAGDLPEHRRLESQLAAVVGLPAALYFSTGYQANLAVLTALAGDGDLVASDAANHASIIDGCRLSRARVAVYAHRDPAAADRALTTPGRFRRRLLVTESLFSMDGDLAPITELNAVAQRRAALLVVDEAHALGVIGPAGAGLCAASNVVPDALVGTLGKAFGVFGGFVAGVPALREWLVNRARTFLFTTAPPPPVAAAAAAAVEIAVGPEGDERRSRLLANITRLRLALGLAPSASPVVPMVLGADADALDASRALLDGGLFVPAIRPPTVPEGSARLRVTLSASHDPREVDRLAAALARLTR